MSTDGKGNFYGTTQSDGEPNNTGTVFQYNVGTGLQTLAKFNFSGPSFPFAGVVVGGDGNLYGTTTTGGSSDGGTLFKIDLHSGALTTLANFDQTTGSWPATPLVQDSAGNFYGATRNGGQNGTGTIFKYNANTGITVLASFDGTFGTEVNGDLIADGNGNFYGTTLAGGSNGGGILFKLTLH